MPHARIGRRTWSAPKGYYASGWKVVLSLQEQGGVTVNHRNSPRTNLVRSLVGWIGVGLAFSTAFGSVALAARGPRESLVLATLPVAPIPTAGPAKPIDRAVWLPEENLPPPAKPVRELRVLVPQKMIEANSPYGAYTGTSTLTPGTALRILLVRAPRGIDATDPFDPHDSVAPPRIVYPQYVGTDQTRPPRPIDRTFP